MKQIIQISVEINKIINYIRDQRIYATKQALDNLFFLFCGETAVVLLFTLPVFYEKYDDKVDFYAEKVVIELKKQYKVFDAKVLSKIPRGPLKHKKRA